MAVALGALVTLATIVSPVRAVAAPAAPFTIVTTVWAVDQLVSGVTLGHARVLDVVPAGANPQGFVPDPAETAEIEGANVVVDIGGGYQPDIESDARHTRHVVSLVPRLARPSDPDLWLIPSQMERATSVVHDALVRADPGQTKTFTNGANAYTAMLLSLDTDYQSSLSDCQQSIILTPDGAMGGLARRYGLADRVVGASSTPTPAIVHHAVEVMENADVGTAFTQPFVPAATVDRAASRAHLKVKEVQTLQGRPPGGWPNKALDTYYRLMEYNLGILVSALNCDLGDAGQ